MRQSEIAATLLAERARTAAISALYFDLRRGFPWGEQFRLYRWVALAIGAWSGAPVVTSVILHARSQPAATAVREIATQCAGVLLPALGIPALGLLTTIALRPWSRAYLARREGD